MKEEIIVIIDKVGGCEIEVNNVRGKKCTDITKQLENALGTVKKQTKKDDYYKQEQLNIRGNA